jgi:hypothetical protein
MAPRGRTPTAAEYNERSYDSSPDPLALSLDENTARPTRHAMPRKSFTSTSPGKRNRRSSVSEMAFSSPSKSMVVNTPRMGNASPWRIKVTVQAEPGSDENERSPSVKRFTKTTTTTIPLKDEDAPAPIKRGRGRPKKSDTGSAAKPKRSGTPKKATSRDVSIGAREADVDTDAPPKKKRGRPRKSVQSSTEEEGTLATQAASSRSTTPVPAGKPKTSSKSTRFATPQASLPGLAKPLRARKGTPHSKVVPVSVSSDENTGDDGGVLTPTSGDEDGASKDATHDPFTSSTLLRGRAAQSDHPTQKDKSKTSLHDTTHRQESLPAGQAFENDEKEDVTNFAFDEGTTRMLDDTTIIDSENFSMISVASLQSNGGLTSAPKPARSNEMAPRVGSMLRHEHLGMPTSSNSPPAVEKLSNLLSVAPRVSPSLISANAKSRPALRRFITPIVDAAVPSIPPVIEPGQPPAEKSETPGLGRVVTAGVALQGLLEPSRLTPEPSQKALDDKRDKLDDLFRGFSTGTKRELQAGLRLGEQLAQDPARNQSPRDQPSPTRVPSQAASRLTVSRTERRYRESRLLTPEDPDRAPAARSGEGSVQYPTLNVSNNGNPLISPAESEDEMSWRVDTPPVARSLMVEQEQEERPKVAQDPVPAHTSKPIHVEDYSDIWQEEASRSTNSLVTEYAPQIQDFLEPGPAAPARGKLPRTWRRESGNRFQYSDEVESPKQPTPPRAQLVEVGEQAADDKMLEAEDEDAASDATDDTGNFFHSNMPSMFGQRQSCHLRRRPAKATEQDLTLLLSEGESIVPESSPPVVTKKSTSATSTNPFLITPPRFAAHLVSPNKSSPLRQELRGSDISSGSPSRIQDESSLPLPQSSPFHTFVDGQSKLSVASDQRQLLGEMESVTDSSIRRVRTEADGYLDAYDAQERTLNGITEITEPSRTWQMGPPQMKMLSPVRKRKALFDSPERPRATPQHSNRLRGVESSQVYEETEANSSSSSASIRNAPPPAQLEQRSTGLLTRMTSTLWSAVTAPATLLAPKSSSPAPHPILAKLTPLPKVEPWTKTHYKTLDKLYSIQHQHAELFSPSVVPATPLSITNAHLLDKFLTANKQPYVGATFSAWGYEFDMTEELVVLCAVFMELMSLKSIKEYEMLKGREIEKGDCLPGRTGDLIIADHVVQRLATVVLGDEVRRDERMGVEIDRRRELEVQWPQ